MAKIFIVLLFIILLFYYFNKILSSKKKSINEYFDNQNTEKINIYFLNKNELSSMLIKDEDNYYKTFFDYDLYARNIKNIDEYKSKIQDSVVNLTEKQKNKLIKCCNSVDEKIKNINFDGFDGLKASTIIWKIGAIKGKSYENGLPHTRKYVIVLPIEKIDLKTNKQLCKLLCHEKVHVYQKKYKEDINKYLEKNNITVLKVREENDMIRANPDLDNYIYTNNNNIIYSAKYNSTKPSSIVDIEYNNDGTQSSEHPFEKMAIDIENLI
jgi:hypothetical protein